MDTEGKRRVTLRITRWQASVLELALTYAVDGWRADAKEEERGNYPRGMTDDGKRMLRDANEAEAMIEEVVKAAYQAKTAAKRRKKGKR